MKTCMVCKKNPATIHLTDIVNNAKSEVDLCEECAKKQGISYKAPSPMTLPDLLALIASASGAEEKELAEVTCPKCGLKYGDFRQTGRLGCPHDYTVFRKGLLPILERVHGSAQHAGRAPGHAGTANEKTLQLMQLKRKLAEAIRQESYEEAAQIRDSIGQLEVTGDD